MIQAQVVELPVTGTHLPYAASVALMWVSDLWAQWCVDTGVPPSDGPWWASGEVGFRPLARGQHSVGHAGSRPIRGTRLLPSGTFAPILLPWTDFATGNVVCREVSRRPGECHDGDF